MDVKLYQITLKCIMSQLRPDNPVVTVRVSSTVGVKEGRGRRFQVTNSPCR